MESYGSLRYSQKWSLISTLHQLNTFDILHFTSLRSCSLCTVLYYLNWSLLRFSYQNLGNFSVALVSCALFPICLNIIIYINNFRRRKQIAIQTNNLYVQVCVNPRSLLCLVKKNVYIVYPVLQSTFIK